MASDYERATGSIPYWPLNYWFHWWPIVGIKVIIPGDQLLLVPEDDRYYLIQEECRNIVILNEKRIVHVE